MGAARAGWRTVATMRDVGRAQRLRDAADAAGVGDLLDVRRLDVVDQASVVACVADVMAVHGRLDAVVNNAGAGHVGTLELETVDDVRAVMEVNFFGVLHVTRAALPHLRAAGGGCSPSPASVGWSVSRSTRRTAPRSSPWRGSWSPSRRSPPPPGSASP